MILNGAELLTEAQVRAQYVDREALTTRASIGVSDYTNLGKIDVQGTDTHAFMNKIYCNAFAKLDVGKTRMA
ncbi:MAG: sarcosine oxidase subunit alpha [Pseudorhodobacter sp.]|jgi:sarcosine oxidase subunit alpha